jgi:hypothetical protein
MPASGTSRALGLPALAMMISSTLHVHFGICLALRVFPGFSRACSAISRIFWRSLSEDLHTPKIILIPARLVVDRAAESLGPKGVTRVVERHRHSPLIGMLVASVATGPPSESKAVTDQSSDQRLRGD